VIPMTMHRRRRTRRVPGYSVCDDEASTTAVPSPFVDHRSEHRHDSLIRRPA
jgi:hypothetical protein